MTDLVLVTGAAGRIGSRLAAGLARRGVRIRGTDLAPSISSFPGSEYVQADLNDSGAVERLCSGVTSVIHLAGHPSSQDWAVLETANIRPTRLLFDAAGAAGVRRVIYASSIHVAGYAPADAELTPSMPVRPDGPYGVTKILGEAMLRLGSDRHGWTGLALRICSYRDRPRSARELRTWISPADMTSLAHAALTADVSGYRAVWGLSNNRRARVDRDHWSEIGFEPVDDAERHADALAAEGIDTSIVSEWTRLGGAMAEGAAA